MSLSIEEGIEKLANKKHKLILKFMICYNMTPCELRLLKLKNINLSSGEIELDKRKALLDEILKAELELYLREYTPKEYLFEGRSKATCMTRAAIHKVCRRSSEQIMATKEPLSPEKLRNLTCYQHHLEKRKLTTFDYRKEAVNTIYSLLKKRRNVLLTGPIGVGKTYIMQNLTFDKKALYLDDFSELKGTLINWLLLINKNDKQKALAQVDKASETINLKCLQKHSVAHLLRSILEETQKYEYVVIVDSIDNIPPRVVKCLDMLKSHFLVVAGAREIPKKKENLLWDFDLVEVKNFSKEEALIFLDILFENSYGLFSISKSRRETIVSKIYSYSNGNPRVMLELFKRFRYNEDTDNISFESMIHEGIKKEINVAPLFPIFIILMVPFKYIANFTENPTHRIIGTVALLSFFVFRYLRRLI